jgi:hypothetical protein
MKKTINKRGGNGLYTTDISYISATEVMNIDDFIVLYAQFMCDILKLSRAEISVLVGCVKHSRINNTDGSDNIGNLIMYDDRCLADIISHYKQSVGYTIAIKTIENAVSSLIHKGLIIKLDGIKFLNSDYFFNGNINKLAKVNVNFTAQFVIDGNEDIQGTTGYERFDEQTDIDTGEEGLSYR